MTTVPAGAPDCRIVCGRSNSAVLKALHLDGIITNGAVRDLPAVKKLGFQMFASCVAVSDAYMHVIGYGQPVEILGLEVHNGDLLYADCHGAISIPPDIVGDLAEVAARISTKEARIVEACLSPDLSREELLKIIQSGRSS